MELAVKLQNQPDVSLNGTPIEKPHVERKPEPHQHGHKNVEDALFAFEDCDTALQQA